MTELPVVIIDVQRGGPSTGLPTKTEQADLLQVLFGRNGECPVPVIAAASPSDCFAAVIEAFTIAVKYMTPVFFLSDGYIANGAEPWLIPDVSKLPEDRRHASDRSERSRRASCRTSATKTWSAPGRCPARRAWSTASADWKSRTSPATSTTSRSTTRTWSASGRPRSPASSRSGRTCSGPGPEKGDVLIVGWGSTFGAIKAATLELRKQGVAGFRLPCPLPQPAAGAARRADASSSSTCWFPS